MKRLFLFATAKLLDKLKLTHHGLYMSIMLALSTLNFAIEDKDVIQLLTQLFGDHYDWNRWIHLTSVILAALLGTRTERYIKQEEGKTLSVAGVTIRKRKFLGIF